MRFAKGAVLPVPPVIAQRGHDLPEGLEDSAGATDCGEACCTSVLEVMTGYRIPVGAIREAMEKPPQSGVTFPSDLLNFLCAMGLQSYAEYPGRTEWDRLAQLRHFGYYRAILGYWVSPAMAHWVLAYEREGDIVKVMDPWTASYQLYNVGVIRNSSLGKHVVVSPS